MQNGDLASLRSLTCGDIRDRYVNYDQKAWDDTSRMAAKRYPGGGQHRRGGGQRRPRRGQRHRVHGLRAAGALNPQLDLQFRDDQWKICKSRQR